MPLKFVKQGKGKGLNFIKEFQGSYIQITKQLKISKK